MPLKLKIYTCWHVFKLVSSHLELHSLISAFSFKKSAVRGTTNGKALCAQPWATQPRDGIHVRSAAETAIAAVSHWQGLTQVWPPSAQTPRQNSLPLLLNAPSSHEDVCSKLQWLLGLWEAEFSWEVLTTNSQFLLNKQLQHIHTAASFPHGFKALKPLQSLHSLQPKCLSLSLTIYILLKTVWNISLFWLFPLQFYHTWTPFMTAKNIQRHSCSLKESQSCLLPAVKRAETITDLFLAAVLLTKLLLLPL